MHAYVPDDTSVLACLLYILYDPIQKVSVFHFLKQ